MIDIVQLAMTVLTPLLPVLAQKASEGAASEFGKQVIAFFRERLKGTPVETALHQAAEKPDSAARLKALESQLAVLIEEDAAFRGDLQKLLAQQPTAPVMQTATVTGDNTKLAQVAGIDNNVNIS